MDNENIDLGEIKVPAKWDDITLEKYQRIEKFYSEKNDDSFNVLDVIDILIDKDRDYVRQLPMKFLDTILAHLMFLMTKPEVGKPTNKIEIDGITYSINPVEKLKMGEYVAIDTAMRNDKSDYASVLAILCRRDNEAYDSKFEAEIYESRKRMFEQQPITRILPLTSFFLELWMMSEQRSQLSSRVEEGISHIVSRLENLENSGRFKKWSMTWQIRKLRKLAKSIECI